MNKNLENSSFSQKLLFALGQVGWCLAVFGFTELIFFFYMPPENNKPLFKAFIYQGSVFKILTIIGLLSSIGYFLSAFMEPIVASLSDRATFKFGKRKTFMAMAIIPFAVMSALVFFPLKDGISSINTIWLSFTVVSAFLIKCFYTTPYNAMINEVAKTQKDRLHLVMMLSITYATGIAIGYTINIAMKLMQNYTTNEKAFQICILIYAIISMIFMSIPIFFVKDNAINNIENTNKPMFAMMHDVWQNKNFRIFAWTELIYWFPSKIFVVALPYFVVTLMKLDNIYTSVVLYICGIGSFVLYPLIDKLVVKYGKKKILLSAFVFLIISYSFTATIGLYKISTGAIVFFYVIFNMYPTAVLGILPMALAGDIAEKDFKETGIAKNASYYGMKSFMMKIGVSITSLIFPSLLLLGKTQANPLGIRLVAVSCVFAAILAFFVMRNYKE